MGLDTSHDAFHGPYSAFNRLRAAVCYCAGGLWSPHNFPSEQAGVQRLAELDVAEPIERTTSGALWFYLPDKVTEQTHPGLYAFLKHSDCDGQLTPEECAAVARDLNALIPALEQFDRDHPDLSWGHIGSFADRAFQFANGCRRAAAAGEVLDFH